jgi:hypothetical protein
MDRVAATARDSFSVNRRERTSADGQAQSRQNGRSGKNRCGRFVDDRISSIDFARGEVIPRDEEIS